MAETEAKPVDVEILPDTKLVQDRQVLEVRPGKPITPIQQRTLELFSKYQTAPKVRAQLAKEGVKVTLSCLHYWMNQPWFKNAHREMVSAARLEFSAKLAANADTIADGVLAVAKGEEKYVKIGNAAVQAGRLFADMGPEPLIDRRPQVQINNNTQVNNLNADPEKFRSMTREERFEFARTGIRPGQE